MKERKEYTQQLHTEIIEIPKDIDFVYVMRKDEEFAMNPIISRVVKEQGLDETHTKNILYTNYQQFEEKLFEIMQQAFSHKGTAQIHTFNPEPLEQAIKQKAVNNPIISLDPLLSDGVDTFPVSRGYKVGGIEEVGHLTRPGYEGTMKDNASRLAEKYSGQSVALAEDDIFSGTSLLKAVETLQDAGVQIAKIIPGIQIGTPQKIDDKGISVDPVIQYKSQVGNIFDKLDLGDPRDFLVGASGLVIALPDGNLGRLPYILPFVSATERASIPSIAEKVFSVQVLQANLQFYQDVGQQLGIPLQLKHMDAAFVEAMTSLYAFGKDTLMTDIVMWSLSQLLPEFGKQESFLETQKQIESLNLPQKMIFIDLNGTLIADDSIDGSIEPEKLRVLQMIINQLKTQGFEVGLCSDSPLPQLLAYGQKIGITGPTIAENGNIIFSQGKIIASHDMPRREEIKKLIDIQLQQNGFSNQADCIAPEFGGNPPGKASNSYAFGANRLTSITLFGDPNAMNIVAKFLENEPTLTVDSDPSYPTGVVIHEGDFRGSKGKMLSLLSCFGSQINMIGNSMSDWVQLGWGVECGFVSDARITPEIATQATYLSSEQLIDGVIDILQKIKERKGGAK